MEIEAKITPDALIRRELQYTQDRDGLLDLARRSYLCFDHNALRMCIEKYEALYHDGGVDEFKWLMETSCW